MNKLTNFNIVWYTLCWNEMPILPFMIDYWSKIANKVVVFDNNSDDGSVEYLKQYDWIEVRPYPIETNNQVNDDIHRRIKDECWKECRGKGVDWVIVSDLDETIWAKDLQGLLQLAKGNRCGWGFEYQFNREQIEAQFNERWEAAKDCLIDDKIN